MNRIQIAKQRILKSKLPLEEKTRLMESYQTFEEGLDRILRKKNEKHQDKNKEKKKTRYKIYLEKNPL